MYRVKNYSIRKESIEDMIKGKRYNPGLELTFTDKTGTYTHKIGAGYSDNKDVYRENGITYLLTRNFGLNYVGLEVFKANEKLGEIFLQIDHDIEEILGSINKAPYNIIKILDQYIE